MRQRQEIQGLLRSLSGGGKVNVKEIISGGGAVQQLPPLFLSAGGK